MESNIFTAQDQLSKSMASYLNIIKSGISDSTKINVKDTTTANQILSTISEQTKRSATLTVSIRNSDPDTPTLPTQLRELAGAVNLIQDKIKGHFPSVATNSDPLSATVFRAIKDLARILKSYIETKQADKERTKTFSSTFSFSSPSLLIPRNTMPDIDLNSDSVNNDLLRSIGSAPTDVATQMSKNTADMKAAMETIHKPKEVSPAVVEVTTEGTIADVLIRSTSDSDSTNGSFTSILQRIERTTADVKKNNKALVDEYSRDFIMMFKDLSYVIEDIIQESFIVAKNVSPSVVVLQQQLGNTLKLKDEAVKREDFAQAQSYKVQHDDIEQKINRVREQDQAVEREIRKAIYEEEKRIALTRKTELEAKLKELRVTKQRAVEKEDFKTAGSVKCEIALLEDELDEKNQYLVTLDKLYSKQDS